MPGDALFRCPRCGRIQQGQFSQALLHGWPICPACNQRMEIEATQTSISAALDQAMRPIIERAGEALHALNKKEE